MTRSEASSDHEEFLDDGASNCSYSSGWERSSSSDHLCASDTDDDDFCAAGEFYKPPRSTGAVKIFDTEYKCELVVLPVPWSKPQPAPLPQPKQAEEVSSTTTNAEPKVPWAKVEPTAAADPWAFLEPPPPPPPPPKREIRRERERERKPPSSRIDNSNTNKLCKHKNDCRMNKHHNCNMVHALQEWKPRVCRFNNSCKHKATCSYYHTNTPLKDYLRAMIKTPDTIYAKNVQYYSKYL